MGALDNFKSKITYENKTIIGAVGIVLAIFFWILSPNIGFLGALLCVLSAILLVIPSPTIKNSKALGIITGIILIVLFIVGISHFYMVITDYMPMSIAFEAGYVESMFMADLLQTILVIYGLFCAFLLTIPTEPKTNTTSNKNSTTNNSEIKFDKYCSECGHGLSNDSKYCPGCGTEVK